MEEMMEEEKEEWSGLEINRKQLVQAPKYPKVQHCAASNQQGTFPQNPIPLRDAEEEPEDAEHEARICEDQIGWGCLAWFHF